MRKPRIEDLTTVAALAERYGYSVSSLHRIIAKHAIPIHRVRTPGGRRIAHALDAKSIALLEPHVTAIVLG